MNPKIVLLIITGMLSLKPSVAQKRESQVTKAVEELRTLMITPDSAKLVSILADKLSYGHSGGFIDNKPGFIQSLLSGKSDFVTINLTDQHISLFEKTASVRHILEADTNDSGKPGHVKLSILTIWYRAKGKWILIARQAVKVQ